MINPQKKIIGVSLTELFAKTQEFYAYKQRSIVWGGGARC